MPLRFLLVILAIAVPWAARASEACNLAGRLVQIEALSRKVQTIGNAQAATRTVDAMMVAINQTPPASARLIADQLGSYGLAQFLESRTRMALIFRTEGLAAAHRLTGQPNYRDRAVSVLMLPSLLGCAEEALAIGSGKQQSPLATHSQTETSQVRQMTGVDVIGTAGFGRVREWIAGIVGLGLSLALAVLVYRRRVRNRRDARYLCDLPVKLATDGDTLDARLIDISANGAKLMIRHEMAPKQAGTLDFGQFGATRFQVVWSNQHYAGIRFPAPLPFALPSFLEESTAHRT